MVLKKIICTDIRDGLSSGSSTRELLILYVVKLLLYAVRDIRDGLSSGSSTRELLILYVVKLLYVVCSPRICIISKIINFLFYSFVLR